MLKTTLLDKLYDKYCVDTRIEIGCWKEFLDKKRKEFKSKIKSTVVPKSYVSKADFNFKYPLGAGAFGKVILAKYKKSNEYYAIKILDKILLIKKKRLKLAINEKKLLMTIRFSFINQMDLFFENKHYLYFCLQFVPGRDLSHHLYLKGKFDEQVAKFFAAQVLLAIEFLHYLDIVYRDIKPENILIDLKGYIKLTDLGLCKHLKKGRTYTVCGTPEYMAPEVLTNQGYGHSVDFWSFGVLIYEFNAGFTPFYDNQDFGIYSKISSGKYNLPKYFTSDLKDIIKCLLDIDFSKRYGLLRNGVDDIKHHKWFQSIIWIALANRAIKAPYIPPPEFQDYN